MRLWSSCWLPVSTWLPSPRPAWRSHVKRSRQLQQEADQMALRQPIDQRGRQEQRLLRHPGAEVLGFGHGPPSHPDRLPSLRSGQIGGRLGRAQGRICASRISRLWTAIRSSLRPLQLGHAATTEGPGHHGHQGTAGQAFETSIGVKNIFEVDDNR